MPKSSLENSIGVSIFLFAHSAGAVEYTDCFSAGEKTITSSVLDMTLNNLMVTFQ